MKLEHLFVCLLLMLLLFFFILPAENPCVLLPILEPQKLENFSKITNSNQTYPEDVTEKN